MRLGWFIAALVAVSVFSFMAARVVQLQSGFETAVQTHDALCIFKEDLRQRAQSTLDYVRMHPNGIPSLGVTAGQLAQTASNQLATVHSLNALRCADVVSLKRSS